MSDLTKKLTDTELDSVISNPFNTNSITSVSVVYRKRMFNLGWIAQGNIEFESGNTKATQKFEGDSFDDVTLQIKTFIKNEL